jgi:phosphate-selective porin OprO and OprP
VGVGSCGCLGPILVQGEYAQLEVDLPNSTLIRNTSTSGATGSTPFFNPNVTNPPVGSALNPVATIANPFLGVPNPTYDGWYVDASLFLTGETRPYKEGRFDRVKVKNPVSWTKGGGWGAWQIAGRYDVLDLSDSAFNNAASPVGISNFTGGCSNQRLGINRATDPETGPANPPRLPLCGDQETWIVGVNWYLTDYSRIMFNYMQTELSDYPVSATTPVVNPNTGRPGFDGATIRGFGVRTQFDW